MSTYFWVVLACTVMIGFFSLVSISLRCFGRVQLEEAFLRHGADRLRRFEHNMPALRLTFSFCRSLGHLVLAISMVYLMDAPNHGPGRTAWALAAAGGIIAVFSVAIPNAWASHRSEKILAATLPVLMFFRYVFYPVAAAMQAFETPVRRLSGVGEQSPEDQIARQEIMQVATEGQAEGSVEPEAVAMIESVMEFGDTRAGEIMTPRTDIFALAVETPWLEACHRLAEGGHSRVPVYEGQLDNIIGILYAKDMLRDAGSSAVGDIRPILRKPFFVPQSKPLNDLLREFKTRQVQMAVVLDEYGGTAGLVTIEDVLEEIVGEIADEYDAAGVEPMKPIDEHTAEIDGRMYIDDLNSAMRIRIPDDEDYDTVAGFVFSELGYIPTVGETLEAHGARFTVLAADERKISRVKVERLPRQEGEDA